MFKCPRCKLVKAVAEWHIGKRRDTYCRECRNAYDREWSAARRATVEGRLQRAELARMWKANNSEQHATKRQAWLAANKQSNTGRTRSRKDALKQRTPAWADVSIMDALTKCAKQMSKDAGTKYVVDHIIPLRGALVSGLHVPFNLRVVTYEANRKKGSFFRVSP